jgi:putative transposase
MPRALRLELAGVPLHIIQRGNNRGACFFSDADRRFYLKCLKETAAARGCSVHAYVLMTNHVHLLVTPLEAGVVSALMQDVGRQYVRAVNNAHARTGTLWEGRYKSSLVDTERYFLACHRYIELNPVRAGMVRHPADYPWSSHAHYANGRADRVLTQHSIYGSLGPTAAERQRTFRSLFICHMEQSMLDHIRDAVNSGAALGTRRFMEEVASKTGQRMREPRPGRRSQRQADLL